LGFVKGVNKCGSNGLSIMVKIKYFGMSKNVFFKFLDKKILIIIGNQCFLKFIQKELCKDKNGTNNGKLLFLKEYYYCFFRLINKVL